MASEKSTNLPAELQPRWRDLPAVAWTVARAFAPRRLGAVLAVTGAPLVFLPSLVAARACGELAASPARDAALVVQRSGPGAPNLRRRLVTAATAVASFVVVGGTSAVAALTVGTAAAQAGVPAELAGLGAGVAGAVPVLLGAGSVLASAPAAARGWWQERDDRRSGAHLSVAVFAAWPPGQGKGTRLAEQVAAALENTDLPIVASARTPDLARVYTRWGLEQSPRDPQRLTSPPREQAGSQPQGRTEPGAPATESAASAASPPAPAQSGRAGEVKRVAQMGFPHPASPRRGGLTGAASGRPASGGDHGIVQGEDRSR
ncbi:MAG TPA: hypothetical protein VFP72_08230 [Kineosporiaceae bacterium]|nr:hypothetical protein [Kineosporiaceae bacterium]